MSKNIYNFSEKERERLTKNAVNVDRETVKYTGQTIGGNTPPLNCDGIELETKSVTIDSLNYTDTVTYDNTKYCGLEKVKISTNIPTDSNKSVTITSNTQTVISPNSGSEAMKQVTVTTNIPLETEVKKTYASNGTFTITPSGTNAAMKKVTVTTNVPQGILESKIDTNVTKTITQNGTTTITPTNGKSAMKQVTITTNVESSGGNVFEIGKYGLTISVNYYTNTGEASSIRKVLEAWNTTEGYPQTDWIDNCFDKTLEKVEIPFFIPFNDVGEISSLNATSLRRSVYLLYILLFNGKVEIRYS